MSVSAQQLLSSMLPQIHPPLQFVPKISKLPRMLQQPIDCHNKRSLSCLFELLLCRKKEKRKKLMV
jgi:hypothetical protein